MSGQCKNNIPDFLFPQKEVGSEVERNSSSRASVTTSHAARPCSGSLSQKTQCPVRSGTCAHTTPGSLLFPKWIEHLTLRTIRTKQSTAECSALRDMSCTARIRNGDSHDTAVVVIGYPSLSQQRAMRRQAGASAAWGSSRGCHSRDSIDCPRASAASHISRAGTADTAVASSVAGLVGSLWVVRAVRAGEGVRNVLGLHGNPVFLQI
jgi:hypothetical protein